MKTNRVGEKNISRLPYIFWAEIKCHWHWWFEYVPDRKKVSVECSKSIIINNRLFGSHVYMQGNLNGIDAMTMTSAHWGRRTLRAKVLSITETACLNCECDKLPYPSFFNTVGIAFRKPIYLLRALWYFPTYTFMPLIFLAPFFRATNLCGTLFLFRQLMVTTGFFVPHKSCFIV